MRTKRQIEFRHFTPISGSKFIAVVALAIILSIITIGGKNRAFVYFGGMLSGFIWCVVGFCYEEQKRRWKILEAIREKAIENEK